MKDRKNVTRRRRAVFTVALLSGLLVAGPAAHATFTSRVAATMSVGTYAMTVPAGAVSANCGPVGGSSKYKLSISVTYGATSRVNNYALRLVSPSGVVTTKDLTSMNPSYDTGNANGVERGTWTYSVQAQYIVPGKTNVWSSAAVPQGLPC